MTASERHYLIDTHAWIEVFIGTPAGAKVKVLLDDPRNEIWIADSTFAEVFCWALQQGKEAGTLLTMMRQYARVREIYTNIWIEAAHHRERMRREHRKDFGLIDALLLAIQSVYGGTIVTGDPHFRGLPNVLYLNP